jgi:hypothetical protein
LSSATGRELGAQGESLSPPPERLLDGSSYDSKRFASLPNRGFWTPDVARNFGWPGEIRGATSGRHSLASVSKVGQTSVFPRGDPGLQPALLRTM